jgi:hypothetical protein
MEDHVHDSIRPLPTLRNDFWLHKCTTLLPVIYGQGLRPTLVQEP